MLSRNEIIELYCSHPTSLNYDSQFAQGYTTLAIITEIHNFAGIIQTSYETMGVSFVSNLLRSYMHQQSRKRLKKMVKMLRQLLMAQTTPLAVHPRILESIYCFSRLEESEFNSRLWFTHPEIMSALENAQMSIYELMTQGEEFDTQIQTFSQMSRDAKLCCTLPGAKVKHFRLL